MDLRYVLYGFWILLPASFFIIALWSKLEQLSGRDKREVIGDYLKQGVFTGACVGLSILIDQTVLESFVSGVLADMVPLGFCRFMLLPVTLVIGAKVVGGSKPIRIERHEQSGNRTKRRGRHRS